MNFKQIIKITDLLLVQCEGLKLNAYKDSAGILTIGIGLARTYPNGQPIKEGDVCTEKEAYEWLNQHLFKNVYPYVANFCNSWNVPDEIFESLCCFVYNEGQSPLLQDSFREAVQARDWKKLANVMHLYNKVRINGVLTYSQGLANRREIEINNFKQYLR